MSQDSEPDFFHDDHVSNLDQMEANVNEVGGLIARYFKNLRELGFTRSEAFALTQDWHGTFWSTAHMPPNEMMEMFDDDDDPHDGL